jgi:hypothetical protein
MGKSTNDFKQNILGLAWNWTLNKPTDLLLKVKLSTQQAVETYRVMRCKGSHTV